MMCLCFPLTLRDIFHTPMARYSLFVLKVPSNTNFGTKMPVALRYASDPFVFNRLLKAKLMFEGLRQWNLVNTGSVQVWIFIAHQSSCLIKRLLILSYLILSYHSVAR